LPANKSNNKKVKYFHGCCKKVASYQSDYTIFLCNTCNDGDITCFNVVLLFIQGLIVDQTIEKVSFCAPDRNHEKGFSYICRDGTTRRWMCHGFLALKESVSTVILLAYNSY